MAWPGQMAVIFLLQLPLTHGYKMHLLHYRTIYLPVIWWCFDWQASTLLWAIPWTSLPEKVFWQVLDTTKNRTGRVQGMEVSSRVLPCGILMWLLWTFPSLCDTWISRNSEFVHVFKCRGKGIVNIKCIILQSHHIANPVNIFFCYKTFT